MPPPWLLPVILLRMVPLVSPLALRCGAPGVAVNGGVVVVVVVVAVSGEAVLAKEGKASSWRVETGAAAFSTAASGGSAWFFFFLRLSARALLLASLRSLRISAGVLARFASASLAISASLAASSASSAARASSSSLRMASSSACLAACAMVIHHQQSWKPMSVAWRWCCMGCPQTLHERLPACAHAPP